MGAVVFPVASCWVWGGGWLQKLGFLDFAGGGPIHLLAAVASLVGNIWIGPRIGAFQGHGKKKTIQINEFFELGKKI